MLYLIIVMFFRLEVMGGWGIFTHGYLDLQSLITPILNFISNTM